MFGTKQSCNNTHSLTLTSSSSPPRMLSTDSCYQALNKSNIMIIGDIVPVTVIAFCISVYFMYQRYRKIQRSRPKPIEIAEAEGDTDHPPGFGPWLQHKAGLEDEDRRKHELEAEEKKYEIADGTIHELPTLAGQHSGRLGMLQKLRSEKFSTKLSTKLSAVSNGVNTSSMGLSRLHKQVDKHSN